MDVLEYPVQGKPSGGGAVPAPDVQRFEESGTWIKPAMVSATSKTVVRIVPPGGGGGSGYKSTTTTGYGGRYGYTGLIVEKTFLTSDLPVSVDVTVGLPGVGGPSKTTEGPGNDGTDGGTSSFGALLSSVGGLKGLGGNTALGNPSTSELWNAGPGGNGYGKTSKNSNPAYAGGDGSTAISPATGGLPNAVGTDSSDDMGGGGGGGGTQNNAGKKGGKYGGGGGGGGGAPNDSGNSGAGGDGGDSVVLVTTYP